MRKSTSLRAGSVRRVDLAAAVYARVGVSREEANHLVSMMLTEIVEALTRGEVVKLSTFGSFVARSKRERVGRNPRTGVEALIIARRVVVFKASRIVSNRLNGGVDVDKRSTRASIDQRQVTASDDE